MPSRATVAGQLSKEQIKSGSGSCSKLETTRQTLVQILEQLAKTDSTVMTLLFGLQAE
jgi:hypothetical protein